jgi:O-acetyl-ADP-ribose deacetylase (regulator of RNase III)
MAGTLIKSIRLPGNRSLSVVIYDLLYEPVDCIVNAANGGLSHGGGIAAAISKAAGPSLDDECDEIVRKTGRVPVGEAVVTKAGKLPFKGVIHAIGPMMGTGDEENKIVKALHSSFQRASEKGWSSLSFPGISSGIFAVPHNVCARAYVRAVKEFIQQHPDSSIKTVRLCLYNGPLLEAVKKELG